VVSKQADGSLAVQDLWSEQFALPLVDASQVRHKHYRATLYAITLFFLSPSAAPRPHTPRGLHNTQDVTLVAPLPAGVAADADTPSDVAAKLTAQPGRLRALLRRKLHSCDPRDLSVTPGLRQPVVWAYGTAWPSYHGDVTRGNIGKHC
jgi:hypothetical protein